MTTAGEDFVNALANRDREGLLRVMAPDIDFGGLTPGRSWAESTAPAAIDNVLAQWFEPQDIVEEIVSIEIDTMLDAQRVGYRFRVRCPDGLHLVEQQMYYEIDASGQICWMRALCSGFRPLLDET